MTELERLKKRVLELESALDDESHHHQLTRNELEEAKDEIDELRISNGMLDTSTLDKQMMFEKLEENWDRIKMSDIEAICL